MSCDIMVEVIAVCDVLAWFFQLVASTFWIASVVAFADWSMGEILSLIGAIAWTIANLVALPRLLITIRGDSNTPPSAKSAGIQLNENRQ